MYGLKWQIVYAPMRGLFWCLFPELQSNEGNKYQNNPWVSTWTGHECTYITLFLRQHTNPLMMMKTTILTHRFHFSLALFGFCWWHNNRLLVMSQLPENCDVTHASTYKVISYSLEIGFILGDIHGLLCNLYPALLIVTPDIISCYVVEDVII